MDNNGYGSQDVGGHWPLLYDLVHKVHHRSFEVNFADGSISLDKWFSIFHDRSSESDDALSARRLKLSQSRMKEAQ